MGDYNFGITSNVSALAPVDYKQNSGAKSFFSNDPVSHNMQDEVPVNKTNSSTSGKQTESLQQTLFNGETIVNNSEENSEDFISLKTKDESTEISASNQLEKQITEVSSISGNSGTLRLALSDSSVTTPTPSFWSGVSGNDCFNTGLSSMKNALAFQNLPSVSNPAFNPILGHEINLSQALLPQRRAITGAHNFSQSRHQQPQSNVLKNFSHWSNPQSTSWSAPQTPNGLLSWNAVNIANQKRTVPNINPGCTQKKNTLGQHSMIISPSNFRRSTSLPLGKQYPHSFGNSHGFEMSSLDENRDGNVAFPFQDHQIASNINSNSMETMRFPLEQQLLDIMKTSNPESQDQFKGYMNYSASNIQNIGNMQDLNAWAYA